MQTICRIMALFYDFFVGIALFDGNESFKNQIVGST